MAIDCHNTPGMPGEALSKYLDDMQSLASRLHGVLNAVAHLENAGECGEGKTTLIFLSEELAAQLNTALDTVNRPKGVA